jgi:hypothetical protein
MVARGARLSDAGQPLSQRRDVSLNTEVVPVVQDAICLFAVLQEKDKQTGTERIDRGCRGCASVKISFEIFAA